MTEFQERPAFYAILPASVRYDKQLKPLERLLYAEITSLCNKYGFCYATSGYFAELYGVTRVHISNCVSHLQKCGYIRVEIDKEAGNCRKIFIETLVNNNLQALVNKSLHRIILITILYRVKILILKRIRERARARNGTNTGSITTSYLAIRNLRR